jgi:hypothetical protein
MSDPEDEDAQPEPDDDQRKQGRTPAEASPGPEKLVRVAEVAELGREGRGLSDCPR